MIFYYFFLGEPLKEVKNKTSPQRDNYFNGDEDSHEFIVDDSFKTRRKKYKENKKVFLSKSNKETSRINSNNFSKVLKDSKEFDLRKVNGESFEDMIYYDNNEDNLECIDIDKLADEIQKIVFDIYNSHLTAEKENNRKTLQNYQKYIEKISLNLDRQYNIFILQILSEKIKEMIKVKI